MILCYSKVGQTSFYQMVSYGCIHFIDFQNIFPLCTKNWRKINLIQTTWTKSWRLCPQINSIPQSHLDTLNDTFIVDFSIWELNFFIVTEKGVERLTLLSVFSDTHCGWCDCSPYTGVYTCHHLLKGLEKLLEKLSCQLLYPIKNSKSEGGIPLIYSLVTIQCTLHA